MKKLTLALFGLFVAVTFAQAQVVQAPIRVLETPKTPLIDNSIPALELRYSQLYSQPLWVIKHIVDHESMASTTKIGDMTIICPVGINKGKPVRARGVIQITECYHPEITDEEAFDPNFSLNYLGSELSKGKCKAEWSTCPFS